METWETAPLDTLTPRQRAQREIREREDAIIADLGIRDSDGAPWQAIRVLATPDASALDLALAVEGIDRDYSHDLGRVDADARRIAGLRRAGAGPYYIRGQVDLALGRIDDLVSRSPADEVRERLLARLAALGVRLPNAHLRCCRWVVSLHRDRRAYRDRPHMAARLAEVEADLAGYGIA